MIRIGLSTYTHKTNQHPQWHQNCVAYSEANHPYQGYPPVDELVSTISAREEIPAFQFFRFKARRYLILNDSLYAGLQIVKTFRKVELHLLLKIRRNY